MNSIADVVDGQVPRSWHEAVAVVQEVAQQLTPGLSPPDPQDVHLDDEGTLTLGFGSESDESPVVQLAKLLLMLLEGTDAPVPLLELARENSRVPPAHSTINSFTRALAFFERPNRASDIAALAGRLGGRGHQAAGDVVSPEATEVREESVDRGLELLREKIAQTEAPRAPADPRLASAVRKWGRPAAAALLLAAVAFAAGAWLRGGGAPAGAGITKAVETAETKLAGVLSKGIDHLGGIEPAPAASAPGAAVEKRRDITLPVTPSAPRAPRTQRARPTDRGNLQAKPVQTPRPVGSSGLPDLDLSPEAGPAHSSSPATSPFLDLTRVYSSADAGVEPARLRKPQLPSQPDPDANTGYFDILVNEQGRVDEVRLISPSRRYYDRMMVAAAKAWLFQPARLNGYAVKYRARIPIIAPPPM